MCGDNARRLELPDLHHVVVDNEGFSRCIAVVAILDNRKMNQNGRLEYAAFIRNKRADICPVGLLVFYLFIR